MIRNFTKKDYNALEPYEGHLTRGYYGKYVYALRRNEFNKMYDVYKSLGYERDLDYSCSSCVLKLVTKLGELYFNYKKAIEEKQNAKK
jgi:hypothetical protein